MNARLSDSFGTRDTLATAAGKFEIHRLARLESPLGISLAKLPFSIRILLEAAVRTCDGFQVRDVDVKNIACWRPEPEAIEFPFKPARVILQDFTGVPCVVDLAAMRDAVARLGADAKKINPLVPVDLVIDHSVQVDVFGNVTALERNAEIEFSRNRERYEFLRWGQKAFSNFRVVPPATGIVHQVNLEFLARGVLTAPGANGATVAYPDTLVGTDSHTTMINGLGVLGWGVGGIEAEAVMLGQPLTMVMPQVVGFRLAGALRDGVTATDLVLVVTQMLRKRGVVDKFVEFYGPGLSAMSLPDRATIANMAPEYGATCGFFPVDAETLRYLERTDRADAAKLVEAYCKEQGLFRTDQTPDPMFSDTLSLDLGDVEPSLAGPKRPQDRVALKEMKASFRRSLTAPVKERGYGLDDGETSRSAEVGVNGDRAKIGHGAVVIAAITSCTNTSNPSVMVGAGLLARNAVRRGLQVQPYVKTSMAPGSKVVTEYLERAGLMGDLQALGFHVVGYGCTSCIVAGTPVLRTDGTAMPIESLPSAGGARLFSPTRQGQLALSNQTELTARGPRECVALVLQDGRTLECTPDHPILTESGRWVQAGELVTGRDRVVVGLEAPLDVPGEDERGWVLKAGDWRFGCDDAADRMRTLAFARLLGHLHCEDSTTDDGQARFHVAQAIDREVALDDIERITGERPAAHHHDQQKWGIVLPPELTRAILALPGSAIGPRMDQPASLPEFVLDPRCPRAVVREFLAGLCGGDGAAPKVERQGSRESEARLGNPAISQSCLPEHVHATRERMRQIMRMLERCQVRVTGTSPQEAPLRRPASFGPRPGGEPRTEVRLEITDPLAFIEKVGYRYNVDKTLRAGAAAVYWRSIGAEVAVPAVEPALSSARGRWEAISERERREALRQPAGAPSPLALFREIGAGDWFARAESGSSDQPKRSSVDKDSITLPVMSLKVIDRRAIGMRDVYDLAMDEPHAFIAGTVAVHNCIGNSGPLPPAIAAAVTENKLVAAAVLSGNRNFEGRVNPHTRANYLASPPLVVAFALAGKVDVDFDVDPLGTDPQGKPVYLRELWPSQKEIADTIAQSLEPAMFHSSYGNVFDGNPKWNAIPVAGGERYAWDEQSTYIHEPPFFQGLKLEPEPVRDITGAHVLVMVGDSVTTDHISPAGDIALDSSAGRWLRSRGVEKRDFNSYGARRGHDLVMVRGTFANIRLKNLLVPGSEGSVTVHFPSGDTLPIFEASERYREARTPLVVLAGKEYGTGSSRDWAAKGTLLLGVRAVLAESYERIHRSNLVGMGVLPLQYEPGSTAESLGLTGQETFDVTGLAGELAPRMRVTVRARRSDAEIVFRAIARLDTPVDVQYYKNGGILQTVLRGLAQA